MSDSRNPLSRRNFLVRSAAASVTLSLLPELLAAQEEEEEASWLSAEVLRRAETLADLQFTDEEVELMRESVTEHLESLRAVRELGLGNDVPPAFRFFPGLDGSGAETFPRRGARDQHWRPTPAELYLGGPSPRRPRSLEELAFAPVSTLAPLLREGRVTSVELTGMFLERLKRLDETLHCVITFVEDRAREKAREADADLAAGRWRGPLHGVPWGAKDLLSVRGYRTTWGAAPFQDQRLEDDAEVVRRLDAAGAVLLAKTSVGALAWGDVWFEDMTRNPWDPEQGSSGSSAGSAAAVAAGGLPFALGTETLGSLVSPSTRCGVTSIRPTFGRVPRVGCMALSWTMDKIGPMARSVEDAAFVLDAIHGSHPGDPDSTSEPLPWIPPGDVKGLRVGYVESAFAEDRPQKEVDDAVLDVLRAQGIDLVPMETPEFPVWELMVVLEVEAAAAFEQLTTSGRDDELVRQVAQAWPNVFRAAQLVPAVQYVQAQRARTVLMRRFETLMREFDVYVAPAFGNTLGATNLTGHPAVVLPNGFSEEETPTSITFIGGLYEEGKAVAVARAYQRATDWHQRHPSVG